MPGRLGELLVRENLITLQQLQKAQEEQKKTGGRLGFNLTKLGYIEETELTAFLSKQYGVPSINLHDFEIERLAGRRITPLQDDVENARRGPQNDRRADEKSPDGDVTCLGGRSDC